MLSGNLHQLLGIPLALIGVLFLALGTQLQNSGVKKIYSNRALKSLSLDLGYFLKLLKCPFWVFGTLLLILAVLAQLVSLIFAPLIVVQPLGALAIALSALINSRRQHVVLSQEVKKSIFYCVGGVSLFVLVTASFAQEDKKIDDFKILVVMLLVFLALVFFGGLIKLGIFNTALSIVGAGILYGLVVSMADVIINRVKYQSFDWFTFLALCALLAAAVMGAYLVQKAHMLGSPDLVVAGLTVIDPLVAIAVGAAILGEIEALPFWGVIIVFLGGGFAIYGVWKLGRYHSETRAK